MIWPGRALATVALLPALLSLGLFLDVSFRPALLAVDVVLGLVALVDLATLIGSKKFRVERKSGSVCSLGEPFTVELTIENVGGVGRILRLRDDVPETMEAEPADFVAKIPSKGRAYLNYKVTPKRRGGYEFQRLDALISSRLGLWQRSVHWPAITRVKVRASSR